MGNPIVLRWVLDRYAQVKALPPDRRSAIEAVCFDAPSLRVVLRSADSRQLERLFRLLPDRLFAPVAITIAENWPGWTGGVARESAGVLARLEPDIALEVFSARIHSGSMDFSVAEDMVRSLPDLPKQPAANLLRIIAESCIGDEDSGTTSHESVLLSLLRAAVGIDPGLVDELASTYFETFDSEFVEDLVFTPVFDCLFGNSVYFEMAGAIQERITHQSFSDLRPFFVEGAPLAELDRQCRNALDRAALAPLLDKWIEPGAWMLLETILLSALEGWPPDEMRLEQQVLVGALAAACARPDLDADTLELQDCVNLLSADLPPVPHLGTLARRLRDFPPDRVNSALGTALEKNRDHYGGSNVATAMGLIGFGDFIVPLTHAMRVEVNTSLCSDAGKALIRIGPPAVNHLIEEWDRLDKSQRLQGCEVIRIVGGEQAVQFALERFDQLMVAEVEMACRLIMSLPDPRFIARLEPHLIRGWPVVDNVFHILTCLFDGEHPQFEAAADRARQHDADVVERMRAPTAKDVPDGGQLPPPQIPLECHACGYVSMYAVERIALSVSGKRSSTMIAEEFPCLACDRITDFGIRSDTALSLLLDFNAKSGFDALGGQVGQRRYWVDRIVRFGDRSWNAVAVIERGKAALERGHEDVGTLLELGLCYQKGLDRPLYAGQFLDRALTAQPRAVEATLLKAEALLRQKEDEAAFALLEEALTGKDLWRLYLVRGGGNSSGFSSEFARLYNRLRLRTGHQGRSELRNDFLPARQRIGRNDPCFCGSGKKYKKCCLN